jgi:large subunit ribosomal protein L22
MQFSAKALYISVSPYKLRPIADVVRGKNVEQALHWLATCALKKAIPLRKVIESAAANAKQRGGFAESNLFIKKLYVDQGPIRRYFKPGAMGRANIQRSRKSHINVELASIAGKGEV